MNNVLPGALFCLPGMQNLLRGVTTCDKCVTRFWGIWNMEEYHAQTPLIPGYLVVSRDSKKTPPTNLPNIITVPLFWTTSGTAGIMPSCIVNIVSSCQDNGKHTFSASLAPRYENSSHLRGLTCLYK